MSRLKDKVVLITGSGMGLGQAMALLFSREGAKIIVPDINTEAGEETVDAIHKEGGDAIFVRADVSKGDDAERMITTAVESYGSVDVLVNNAGVQVEKNVPDTTEEEWDYVLGCEPQRHLSVLKSCYPADASSGRWEHYLYLVHLRSRRAAKPSVLQRLQARRYRTSQIHGVRPRRRTYPNQCNLPRIYEHTDGSKHPRGTSRTVSQSEPFRPFRRTDRSRLCRPIPSKR